MRGFEPLTPSLPWKCSTPELHWLEDTDLNNLLKRDPTGLNPGYKSGFLL
jgi:hypothetical protein